MKQYAKLVEAEQFNGDVQSIAEFVGEDSRVFEEEGKVILSASTGNWNVVPGDYIVKEFKGPVVYKASRFEEEYSEVTVADTLEQPVENTFIPEVNHALQTLSDIPATVTFTEEAPAPKKKI